MATLARAIFSPTEPSSPLSVSPAQTALLLLDYQNLVLARLGPAAPSVLDAARQMRDWALHRGMPVFHCLIDTRVGAKPQESSKISPRWKMYEEQLARMPELGREADVLAPAASPDSSGSDSESGREMTVVRTPGVVSALESAGLVGALRERGVKSLMLCGVSTSGCVLSTVRAATDAGFVVTVVEDACFDPVPGLHGMLVTHVLPTTAHVATGTEVRDAWKVL